MTAEISAPVCRCSNAMTPLFLRSGKDFVQAQNAYECTVCGILGRTNPDGTVDYSEPLTTEA